MCSLARCCCSGITLVGITLFPYAQRCECTANTNSGVQQQRLPFGFAGKGTFLGTPPLVRLFILPINGIDATGASVVVLVFRGISFSWSLQLKFWPILPRCVLFLIKLSQNCLLILYISFEAASSRK